MFTTINAGDRVKFLSRENGREFIRRGTVTLHAKEFNHVKVTGDDGWSRSFTPAQLEVITEDTIAAF